MSAEADLQLEVSVGPAAGLGFSVDERLVIGRQSEGHGRLGDDPELSRQHATILRRADGTYTIEDLASTNGTLVNGSRISEPAPLSTQDTIEVGGTTLSVAFAPAAPAPEASAPAVDPRAATVTVATPPEMRASAPPAPDTPPVPLASPPAPAPLAPPTEPLAPSDPSPAPPQVHESEPATAEAPTRMPRLELHLIVDPEAGEAEIRLDGQADPIRMSFRDGRWLATSETD